MADGEATKPPIRTGRRRPSSKPTLKTIADLTGLAITTVSRALAGAPQIALETRERVRAVADEIGYQPDRAALRLRTGRTHVISLILDPHDEIIGYGTSMINGLMQALRGTAYHLVVTPHFPGVPDVEPVRHILKNNMADGLLFARTGPFDERVKLLTETDFPFVSHGRTEFFTPHAFVDYDNTGFAQKATESLIASGCRRPALILPPRRYTFAQHLLYGFMTAVRAAGVVYEIVDAVTLDSPSDEIRRFFSNRFAAPDCPDGVVCGGEVSALAVMAAASDLGLLQAGTVKIVTKQTSGLFDEVRPRIGSLYEDLSDAGRLMGEFLLRRIAGEPVENLQHIQHVQARPSLSEEALSQPSASPDARI
ncbi:MAG: LacI family transcriptional regulator [Shinella sp.]|nr:MAG: LacI family transcriptional regulator [Shinella sp.]